MKNHPAVYKVLANPVRVTSRSPRWAIIDSRNNSLVETYWHKPTAQAHATIMNRELATMDIAGHVAATTHEDARAIRDDEAFQRNNPRVAKVKDRTNRLKAIGNGQVPLVVAVAFQLLGTE